MFELAWPWMLVCLPLPWLVRRFFDAAPPAEGGTLFAPFATGWRNQARDTAGRVHGAALWWWGGLLCWLLLIAAAARPQWLGEPMELPETGRNLLLAVDVSGSMEQQDYRLGNRAMNRLDAVKAVAGRFIQRRQGDRLGLILFGTRAYVQTPLTFDRATVSDFLNDSVIGLAGRETAHQW